MSQIAVIGGGAAGIGAARALLAEGFDVVLLEAAPRLGGNCLGVPIADGRGGTWTIDAGVSDFNRTTFREFSRLVDDLGLPTRPIGTDTSFATVAGRSVASCRGGRWHIAQGLAGADALPDEIERFRLRAPEVLDDDAFAGWTVARYLDFLGATPALRELYVYPRAMGCFPMPDLPPGALPVRSLVEFWRIHGLVGHLPANRHCIVGGMHRYLPAFTHWFTARGGELRCGTRVLGIVRSRGGVEIRVVDQDDRHRRILVSQVVLASSPREALGLLEAPAAEEAAALRRFAHQRAHLVVHHDERLVGSDRAAWGAFHYVVPQGDLPRTRPTITFFPNRLAHLPAAAPDVFVTMNPHLQPRPERIVAERFFVHPIASASHAAAAARLQALQGCRRTWFAGSWLRSPFVHESALVSGIRTAELLAARERGRRGVAVVPLSDLGHGGTRASPAA